MTCRYLSVTKRPCVRHDLTLDIFSQWLFDVLVERVERPLSFLRFLSLVEPTHVLIEFLVCLRHDLNRLRARTQMFRDKRRQGLSALRVNAQRLELRVNELVIDILRWGLRRRLRGRRRCYGLLLLRLLCLELAVPFA
jgi:hypothetical protein